MNDEQFRELRQMLLDMNVRLSELELHLKRQDDIATHRQNLIYEWCAPQPYKQVVESDISIPGEDLETFLNRIRT